MNLLLVTTPSGSTLLPQLRWAFLSAAFFFFVLIDARPDAIFSSGSSLPPQYEPAAAAPLFSPQPQPPSPEMGVAVKVVVVHIQDLNRRILVALIVACSLLGIILLSLSFIWIYRLRTKTAKDVIPKSKRNGLSGDSNGPAMDPIADALRMGGKKSSVVGIDYKVLEAATNSFHESNILGEGGHGCVYRAQFNDKLFGAVKRLEGGGQDVETQFENEVKWLTKFQHQNIISVLGHCFHGRSRFLVYEMMQNGSLESQLHGPTSGAALTWHLRLRIAVDIARGMEYLHEHCHPPVVHRDIKSSNILLDSNFNAKLSDFGLAVASGNQNKSITLSGTLGYVAPEYLLDGKLSDKSDVYAFGVVLLELLTGRKPVEQLSTSECQSIVSWAMPQLTDRSKLPNIVDPVIKDSMDLKHLYQVAAVAVLCVQREASYRPLITDVLHSLIPLVPLELGGSLRITEGMPTTVLS